jgi:hypothetical protein
MDKEEKEKVLQEIVNEIKPIVKSLYSEKSKITVLESDVDEYGTKTITLCGGLNGIGEWKDYFTDLTTIFEELDKNGFNVWVIRLDNDCLDDIFYCRTGITRKKNE